MRACHWLAVTVPPLLLARLIGMEGLEGYGDGTAPVLVVFLPWGWMAAKYRCTILRRSSYGPPSTHDVASGFFLSNPMSDMQSGGGTSAKLVHAATSSGVAFILA